MENICVFRLITNELYCQYCNISIEGFQWGVNILFKTAESKLSTP